MMKASDKGDLSYRKPALYQAGWKKGSNMLIFPWKKVKPFFPFWHINVTSSDYPSIGKWREFQAVTSQPDESVLLSHHWNPLQTLPAGWAKDSHCSTGSSTSIISEPPLLAIHLQTSVESWDHFQTQYRVGFYGRTLYVLAEVIQPKINIIGKVIQKSRFSSHKICIIYNICFWINYIRAQEQNKEFGDSLNDAMATHPAAPRGC